MFENQFSPEQINQLKQDFSNLKTVDQKFEFWQNSLKTSYESNYFFTAFEAFQIKCQNPIEFETLNRLIFQEAFAEDRNQSKGDIFNIEFFIENFNQHLNELSDKKKFIELEIKNIQDQITFKSLPQVNSVKRSFFNSNGITNEVNKLFVKAYNDFYLYEREFDLSIEKTPLTFLIAINNGKVYAEYHNFLNSQLGNKELSTKKDFTTLPKQLLILHYMGCLNSFDLSNRKNGILLGTLLNSDSDNLRKELPNFVGNKLQAIKNKKHLLELIELFREVRMPHISKMIENDIVRLKKDK